MIGLRLRRRSGIRPKVLFPKDENGRIPDLLCGREQTELQEKKLTFNSRELQDRPCIAVLQLRAQNDQCCAEIELHSAH